MKTMPIPNQPLRKDTLRLDEESKPNRTLRPLICFLLALSLEPLALLAQVGQTVRWDGGDSYRSWMEATHWNPQLVPLNNAATNFTVIVPDGTSLTYDSGGGARSRR